MLGIVLVMHEPLASAMASCVKHIMGQMPERFVALDVPADHPIEATMKLVGGHAMQVNDGAGVVFMTDLFGATPSNAAVRASMEMLNVPSVLVAGCNLPMILRALGFREVHLSQVAEKLVTGGRNGIVGTGATAPQTQTLNPADNHDSARSQNQQ
ncbi:MAG: PTS fructose transporter subunit IIA [Limnobacter sp.]|nr:PTS fructose transporter subunit IIA [Limnobacter sp.]